MAVTRTAATPYDRSYYDTYTGVDGAWAKSFAKRATTYRALLRRLLRAVPSPSTVVEIGCGVGFLSALLARLPGAPTVYSTELSADGLRIASTQLRRYPNLRLLRADAEGIPLRSAAADLVVCMDVVEHLGNPEGFFREANRVLAPGGALLFSTPNPGSLGHRLKGRTPRDAGAPPDERQWEWFGYRDDTHVNIRPIPSWRAAARANGFVRLHDGTDFWWDTPYLRRIPLLGQKILFNGSHRVLSGLFGFWSWEGGENYYGIWAKPAGGTRAASC